MKPCKTLITTQNVCLKGEGMHVHNYYPVVSKSVGTQPCGWPEGAAESEK